MNEQNQHITNMHAVLPKKHPRSTHVKIPLGYYNTNCCYCSIKLTKRNFTKEHVIPKSKGGKWIEPCCKQCNGEKADLSLIEYINLLSDKAKITIVEWEKTLYELKIKNATILYNKMVNDSII